MLQTSTSLRLHVKAEQHILVAEVELAVGNDRMRPTVLVGAVGLVEPAFLAVTLGRGLHQREDAFAAFAAQIEMAVGIRERTLADARVFPDEVAVLNSWQTQPWPSEWP